MRIRVPVRSILPPALTHKHAQTHILSRTQKQARSQRILFLPDGLQVAIRLIVLPSASRVIVFLAF